MFADDIALVKQLVAKYGPAPQPVIDVGGLSRPCVADYQVTIEKMRLLEGCVLPGQRVIGNVSAELVIEVQKARYLDIERPLSFLGDYVIENPEAGGLPLERLAEKYNSAGVNVENVDTRTGDVVLGGPGRIGTAILLSVLEHVADPFHAIDCLWQAMKPGGIAIVSVPFAFPHHPQGGSGEDNFRFTPTGLRHVFGSHPDEPKQWEVLACDWRLRIGADQGVLDIHTMRPQSIESCFIAARAVG